MLEKAKASADESANRISDLERKTQSDDSQIQQLRANNDTIQSQLNAVKGELEKANQTVGESSTKVTELQKKVADAQADKDKLQTALDEANSEIEQLKTDLQQKTTVPSQDGNSLSAPPSQ